MRRPLLVGAVVTAATVATVVCARGPSGDPAPAPAAIAAPASASPTTSAAALPAAIAQAAPPANTSAGAIAFDGARAWEHLRQLVAIGPRPAGSPALRQARAYLTRHLAAAGLTVQEQPFVANTPLGRIEMTNLIVRLPGRRADRILITGHYDTKLMRDAPFVGASDGASSAALLVELARVLASRPRTFTYEFVWFDGEEAMVEWRGQDHTYGSRYYVEAARRAGALTSIKAMVLVDMIGDADLVLRRDTNSTPWLTDIIWATARRMAYGQVFSDATTAIEDDHLPFLEAGVPSVDLIDLDYPYWHTPDDTLDHVSQRSLQTVGDVLIAALPEIEATLGR